MTVGKGSLLALGVVAVFAVGAMTGPTIRDSWSRMHAPEAAVATPPAEQSAPAPAAAESPAPRAGSSSSGVREAVSTKKASNRIGMVTVSLWEPALRDRVKAVLRPGTSLEIAAEDFDSAEQFVTVAHAAQSSQVPFMVLKDRVLNHGQSLAEAIHEFKPELDAKAEVTRARQAARSDLSIAG